MASGGHCGVNPACPKWNCSSCSPKPQRAGGFHIGSTDIGYVGGLEPELARFYNSESSYRGLFGRGWGTEYETWLEPFPDGTVTVHEYGGSVDNTFRSAHGDPSTMIEAILAAAREQREIHSGADEAALRQQLVANVDVCHARWARYRPLGLLTLRAQMPVGQTLLSSRLNDGMRRLESVREGFVEHFQNGRMEHFDLAGRKVRISDASRNYVSLRRDAAGRPREIVDNQGRALRLTYNPRGLVARIEKDDRSAATYEYNVHDELIRCTLPPLPESSSDSRPLGRANGSTVETIQYEYNDRHNLTRIAYADNTAMEISYERENGRDRVTAVKDRDDTRTTVRREVIDTPFHVRLAEEVHAKEGNLISSTTTELFFARDETGDEWIQRRITNADGDVTETTYMTGALPQEIKHVGEATRFRYDLNGSVTEKVTSTEITTLQYDPHAGKVARVERRSLITNAQPVWSRFTYDWAGNLKFAENSEGKSATLEYDGGGRIRRLTSEEGRQIEFEYNIHSKPLIIRDPSLGTITVAYTPSGAIAKVESTAGRKIALEVTSAFQNLMNIIRPAGVTLSY
jgi:YD repeat-containing protein